MSERCRHYWLPVSKDLRPSLSATGLAFDKIVGVYPVSLTVICRDCGAVEER